MFEVPNNLYTLGDNDWIIDTETNSLVNYEKLWVAVARNYKTDEVKIFRNVHENKEPFLEFLKSINCCIAHNGVGFDASVIRHFTGFSLNRENLIDTLILSKLFNFRRQGGHSLENWGASLGHTKSNFNDFSQYSFELEHRCIEDTAINRRILQKFERYILTNRWKLPIYLEHTIEFYNRAIKEYGFNYNINYHKELKQEIYNRLQEIQKSFDLVFPKDFNPGSPKQRIDVLWAAGWKPTSKTDGHKRELKKTREKAADPEKLKRYKIYGWKTDEENLATLPPEAPEAARKLVDWLLLSSRLGDLEEWEKAYSPVSKAIHPTITSIGSWTHRRSHSNPNCANIPALINRKGEKQPYGYEMRSLWKARDGHVLVGTDAEGIQLRIFAHYSEDDRLIEAVAKGRKEDKTDIHNLNMSIIGPICKDRQVAKTYIYAKFLGASITKIAEIFNCTRKEAEEADKRILRFYPGWARLKRGKIPADARRGYFEGLDGRLVLVPSEYHVLAGYLQNGESIIMKLANIFWNEELTKKGVPFHQVNDVQDEWQTEVPELGNLPHLVGKTQVRALEEVGKYLKLRCPLTGEYKIGHNWAETH